MAAVSISDFVASSPAFQGKAELETSYLEAAKAELEEARRETAEVKADMEAARLEAASVRAELDAAKIQFTVARAFLPPFSAGIRLEKEPGDQTC